MQILASIMIINAALTFAFGVRETSTPKRNRFTRFLVGVLILSSTLWSLSFGILFLQTNFGFASFCRSIGLLGVVFFLIAALGLVASFSFLPKKVLYLFNFTALSGVFLYPLMIGPNQATFFMTKYGISYTINNNFGSTIYIVYCVVMAVLLYIAIFDIIRKADTKRLKNLGYGFLYVSIIVVLGMVVDTIMPLLGLYSLPASSIFQCWGAGVLLYALRSYANMQVTIGNMSEFVYYSLSVPIVVYNYRGKAKIVNDAAINFFNLSRETLDMETLNPEYLFATDAKDFFDSSFKRKAFESVCRNNGAHCSITIDRIEDKYGEATGYIMNISDMTEHIASMQKLEEARLLAEKADRSKSDFLANVSHEIRTPMNAILGFSELMLKNDLSEENRGYVEDIHFSSQNLLNIVNDVLDISKIESGKMELVEDKYELAPMLINTIHIIESEAAKKKLELTLDIDATLPTSLYGDIKRIKEVLINLLNNAVKYTEQGSVSFKFSAIIGEFNTFLLHGEISDTGIGIKPEVISNLFDAYTRFDSKKNAGIEGTGLGLAVTKNLIEMMGGRIWLTSEYGVGTTFYFEIPQKVIDNTPIGAISSADKLLKKSSISALDFSNLRVLVVDDSLINLKVATKLLNSYKIEADNAKSGAAAIEMCEEHEYDLILMDQMMPEMDGVEAMKSIRSLDGYYSQKQVKIIACTANAISGVEDTLLKEGFDGYISKPIIIGELEKILKSVH